MAVTSSANVYVGVLGNPVESPMNTFFPLATAIFAGAPRSTLMQLATPVVPAGRSTDATPSCAPIGRVTSSLSEP